jgi:hypothetical protein
MLVRLAMVLSILACGAVTMTGGADATNKASNGYVIHGLICIHHYEGAWNDATGNGFWGGLQMDRSFQQSYGYKTVTVKLYGRVIKRIKVRFTDLWGTADHWPIKAQLDAGVNAYRSRGWYPWPNTARYCGLM